MSNLDSFPEKQMNQLIQRAFWDFKTVFKGEIKNAFKKLNRDEKYAAGRSLVLMGDVAKDPKKYFSRQNTEDAWNARANEYAVKHNLTQQWQAFYIVPSPTMLVTNKLFHHKYVNSELHKMYHTFCDVVSRWEYAITASDLRTRYSAEQHACQICEIADRINNIAYVRTTSALKRAYLSVMQKFGKAY